MFLCPERRTALNKLFQKDWESFKSSPHQTACLEYPINLLCNGGKKHKDGKKHIKSKLVYWWFVYQRFWMGVGGGGRGGQGMESWWGGKPVSLASRNESVGYVQTLPPRHRHDRLVELHVQQSARAPPKERRSPPPQSLLFIWQKKKQKTAAWLFYLVENKSDRRKWTLAFL